MAKEPGFDPDKVEKKLTPEDLEMIREDLDYFIHERDDCIDEIPENKLQPGDKNYYLYKCRLNWFTGIMGRCDWYLTEKILNKEADEKARAFIKYVQDMPGDRTKPEDIKYGNQVLDYFIDYFEGILAKTSSEQ